VFLDFYGLALCNFGFAMQLIQRVGLATPAAVHLNHAQSYLQEKISYPSANVEV